MWIQTHKDMAINIDTGAHLEIMLAIEEFEEKHIELVFYYDNAFEREVLFRSKNTEKAQNHFDNIMYLLRQKGDVYHLV